MKKKRFALVLSLVMAVSMGMTACGDSDDDDDDEDEDKIPKYEQPIEDYFDAIESASAKKLKKCIPNARIEYMEKNTDDIDKYFEDVAQDIKEEMEDKYGKNYRINYTVKEKEKLSDEKIEEIDRRFEEWYRAEVNVTDGYKIKLEVSIKGDDEGDKDNMTVTVAKFDGVWYVTDGMNVI